MAASRFALIASCPPACDLSQRMNGGHLSFSPRLRLGSTSDAYPVIRPALLGAVPAGACIRGSRGPTRQALLRPRVTPTGRGLVGEHSDQRGVERVDRPATTDGTCLYINTISSFVINSHLDQ